MKKITSVFNYKEGEYQGGFISYRFTLIYMFIRVALSGRNNRLMVSKLTYGDPYDHMPKHFEVNIP